jgi:hypothetical protein
MARAYYAQPLHRKKMAYPYVPADLPLTDRLSERFLVKAENINVRRYFYPGPTALCRMSNSFPNIWIGCQIRIKLRLMHSTSDWGARIAAGC